MALNLIFGASYYIYSEITITEKTFTADHEH